MYIRTHTHAQTHARMHARSCTHTHTHTHTHAELQIHHDAKHPKDPWEPEKCINQHADGPVYQGVAVRGSKKK